MTSDEPRNGTSANDRARNRWRLLLAIAMFRIIGAPIIGVFVEIMFIIELTRGNRYTLAPIIGTPLIVAIAIPVGIAQRRRAIAALRELDREEDARPGAGNS